MKQEDIDCLLEIFDEPTREEQRRFVVGFVKHLAKVEDKLARALALTNTGSNEFKKTFPLRSADGSHFTLEAISGWRVVEKIREVLLDG